MSHPMLGVGGVPEIGVRVLAHGLDAREKQRRINSNPKHDFLIENPWWRS